MLLYQRSYETVVKRWPVILTNVIDHLHQKCHDFAMEVQREPSADKQELDARMQAGKDIIGSISKLKYQMARDHKLEYVALDCA